MKTIILGDTHGRSFWKSIVTIENADRVIFIGDYFDSWDIGGEAQINNFLDIIEFKKTYGKEVILLIGNHDHHYFKRVGYSGTSGYQPPPYPLLIEEVLEQNKEHLQMAYQFDSILCTHAGVTETWLEHVGWDGVEDKSIFINNIWKYKPLAFCFGDFGRRADPSGNNIWQSPIWVRPESLMRDRHNFKKDIIQVVGHTQQRKIDIEGKATGGRYYFIDTLGTSGEYLVIKNNIFYTNKI